MKFKTYVINLDTQPVRWQKQSAALRAVGLSDVIRISASTIDSIPREDLKTHFRAWWLIPQTVIACAHSHIRACRALLADTDGDEVALVLEDDAYPLFDNAHTHLGACLARYRDTPWDILSLHCDGPVCPTNPKETVTLAGSTAAQFISRQGAEKILKLRIWTHIDLLTSMHSGIQKIVDIDNSFWADEEGIHGESSTNRQSHKSISMCRSILGKSNTIPKRGEKDRCQSMAYTILRVPGLGCELTATQIAATLIIVILLLCVYCITKKGR